MRRETNAQPTDFIIPWARDKWSPAKTQASILSAVSVYRENLELK
jgi:hypothetical protein